MTFTPSRRAGTAARPPALDTGYRCPFCGLRRPPLLRPRRTLQGNLVFAVVFLAGLCVVLGGVFALLPAAGDNPVALISLSLFALVVFALALWGADYATRSWRRVCPRCGSAVGN